MKNIAKILFLLSAAMFLTTDLFAATADITSANPEIYKIMIKKIRFYNSGAGVWVSVTEKGFLVDIASAGAGEIIDKYINWASIPQGAYVQAEVIYSISDTTPGVDAAAGTYTRVYQFPRSLEIKNDSAGRVKVKFNMTGPATEPQVIIEVL